MNTQAVLKYQKISAQKCRLVANEVRGLSVNKAFEFLTYSNKKASQLILKVLESAVANAEHNNSSRRIGSQADANTTTQTSKQDHTRSKQDR